MRQALHIFRKDLRRGWPLLLLWAGMLGTWLALNWPDPLVSEPLADPSGLNLPIILAALFGVSLLVHQDPLTGTSPFWMSRPIKPGALLVAKAAFVAIFLAAPTVVLHWAVLLRFDLPPEQWPSALLQEVIRLAFLFSVAFGFAAVTPSTTAYFVTLFSVLAGSIAVAIAVALFQLDSLGQPEDDTWRTLGSNVMMVFLLLGAAAYQYLTRRRRVSIAVIALASVLPVPLRDGVGPAAQLVIEGSAPVDSVAVELSPGRGRERFPALQDSGKRIWFNGTASARGLPAGHDLELIGVRGRVQWDGHEPTPVRSSAWTARQGLEEAVGLSWAAGREMKSDPLSLRFVSGESLEAYLDRAGRLTAKSAARLWRLEPAAYLPLETGAGASAPGWAAMLAKVEHADGLLRLTIRLRHVNGWLWPFQPPVPLLINRVRSQMLGATDQRTIAHHTLGQLLGGNQFQFEETVRAYAADESWLAAAELLFLHYRPAGRLSATVRNDRLELEEPRPRTFSGWME